MKNSIRKIALLNICMLSPLLIAMKEVNVDRFDLVPLENDDYYKDFDVTYREVENTGYQNLYEFVINNNGNEYIDKSSVCIYGVNDSWAFGITPIYEGIDEMFYNQLIKPGETCSIYSQIYDSNLHYLNENDFSFRADAIKPNNDVLKVSGPYELSITENKYSTKRLNINCEIKQLKELKEESKIEYRFYYAVSLDYDGTEMCLKTDDETELNSMKIFCNYSSNIEIDKITIKGVEGFYRTVYVMNCFPEVSSTLLPLFIILGICAFAGLTVLVVVLIRRRQKKNI